MSATLDVARVAAGLNVVLLAALAAIWMRNYRVIRSRQTLGSVLFAGFLLAENALAFYYYNFATFPLSAPAIRAMMYLQILEAVGVAALVYVTWE